MSDSDNTLADGIDEVFGHTDSSYSNSSGSDEVYGSNDHFVLELHELKRDVTGNQAELPAVKTLRTKKKKKKKTKQPETVPSGTSTPSEGSTPSLDTVDTAQEQFYSAHGSVHTLPGSPSALAAAPVGAALMMAQSDPGQPKTHGQGLSTGSADASKPVAQKTVTKPTKK